MYASLSAYCACGRLASTWARATQANVRLTQLSAQSGRAALPVKPQVWIEFWTIELQTTEVVKRAYRSDVFVRSTLLQPSKVWYLQLVNAGPLGFAATELNPLFRDVTRAHVRRHLLVERGRVSDISEEGAALR